MKSEKCKIKIKSLKILILSFIFSFFIFNFTLIFAQESSKEAESLFVAQKAFEDGFYDVSLGLLERFLKNYPDSDKKAEVDLFIGRCYFHQSRFLDALAKFEELMNQPKAALIRDASLYWVAEVHFKGNNFAKATGYYKAIVDNYPKSAYLMHAYYSLGWCFFAQGKFAQALESFKAVEEKYPKESLAQDASFKVVECLYNLKDHALLKDSLRNYLKIYSNDASKLPYLYFYLAEAEYYLSNFSQAIEQYSKAIMITSDQRLEALSKLSLGWAYLKLKRYKEAQDIFSEIKAGNLEKKNQDVLLLGEAMLSFETNKFDDAKNIYSQLIGQAADPVTLAQAYLGKADALYNLAQYKQAIEIYKSALDKLGGEFYPREIADKLHYGLAWAYLKEGEFKEAIEEFQKVANNTEDKIIKVSALAQMGDAYQDSGDYAKAAEIYSSILKDYNDSFYGDYVQYQLGMALLKALRYDEAIMAFKNLNNQYSDSKLLDEAYYALGLTYFQREDYNSAFEILEQFDKKFKDSNLRPQAMYLLGTTFYNLGKFARSIEIFKEVVRVYNQDAELTQKAEYEIADCLYQMGNEKGAMERFKWLRSKYPDSSLTAEVMWWLGEYYWRHNDLLLSRRYFSSLIRDFPKSNLIPDAYYVLGLTYEEESNFLDAVGNFKKVIEFGKSDLAGQAAIAMADIEAKEGDTDTALKMYRDIAADYPNLANLIYPKTADLLQRIGSYDKAVEFYRKSLEMVPVRQMADVQLKIAESYEAEGKASDAIEEYMKIPYLYSENNSLAARALLRVAAIYEGQENFTEASRVYQKIVSMNIEEAKYAQERMDWIAANTRTRKR